MYGVHPAGFFRMAYEARILDAKNYPKHWMSIVIDGRCVCVASKPIKVSEWLLDSNPLIFFSSGTPNNAHPVRTSPN
jgi:hypothetical protein